jgi:hypothetical protein
MRAGRVEQFVEVDLTGGISGAGEHAWDPLANTVLTEDPDQVVIVGQTDPTYHITWDYKDGGRFRVADVADGSDTTSGTNAGKLRVRVEGLR